MTGAFGNFASTTTILQLISVFESSVQLHDSMSTSSPLFSSDVNRPQIKSRSESPRPQNAFSSNLHFPSSKYKDSSTYKTLLSLLSLPSAKVANDSTTENVKPSMKTATGSQVWGATTMNVEAPISFMLDASYNSQQRSVSSDFNLMSYSSYDNIGRSFSLQNSLSTIHATGFTTSFSNYVGNSIVVSNISPSYLIPETTTKSHTIMNATAIKITSILTSSLSINSSVSSFTRSVSSTSIQPLPTQSLIYIVNTTSHSILLVHPSKVSTAMVNSSSARTAFHRFRYKIPASFLHIRMLASG